MMSKTFRSIIKDQQVLEWTLNIWFLIGEGVNELKFPTAAPLTQGFTYYRCEELGRTPTSSHKGGTGHIFGNVELLNNDFQRGDEKLIAHNGQRTEHVNQAKNIKHDGTISLLLHREQFGRVQS